MTKSAIFLDRDGTINREVHHLHRLDQFELIPGALESVKLLYDADHKIVVITNQSAVARGLLDLDGLAEIHAEMLQRLQDVGVTVDGIYHCPHHPTAGIGVYRQVCECRKPQPGMLLQAATELDIDLERSFMVGDNLTDLLAGIAAGCRTVLVRTGHGQKSEKALAALDWQPDFVADDLSEAAEWIIEQEGV